MSLVKSVDFPTFARKASFFEAPPQFWKTKNEISNIVRIVIIKFKLKDPRASIRQNVQQKIKHH